jgi:hypothetical protein
MDNNSQAEVDAVATPLLAPGTTTTWPLQLWWQRPTRSTCQGLWPNHGWRVGGGKQGASDPSLARDFFLSFRTRSFVVVLWRLLGMGGQKGGREIVTLLKSLVLGLLAVFVMGDALMFFYGGGNWMGGQKGKVCGQKVCFVSESMCFLIVRYIKSMHTSPAVHQYLFHQCRPCPHHVLA